MLQAHQHGCQVLQQAALEHIVSNFETLKSMPSYKDLTPDLLTMIIDYTLNSKQDNTSPMHKRRKTNQCHEVGYEYEIKEEH